MSTFKTLVLEIFDNFTRKEYFNDFNEYLHNILNNLLNNIFGEVKTGTIITVFKNRDFSYGSETPEPSEECVIEIRLSDQANMYNEAKYKQLVDALKTKIGLDFNMTHGTTLLSDNILTLLYNNGEGEKIKLSKMIL